MTRQKELSQEMSDLHNQYDSDFPPDVQKHYDGLVKEYRDCQNHAEELKYQEAKLESNNVHIAEQLDKPYVPTSDMNGAQNRQQKMDGLQSSLNDLESKIDAGKATPMDAYEFASTKQMMKDDIAHPANRNEPFGVKDPESLGKMDAQVDRISDKLAEQFKDYKFHDDGTYTRTTEKSWDAYGVKTGAREYTDREGNRITKSSEISVGSGQGKIERTADIYTDKGRRLDASVHFDGFRTRSEKTIEGADHSCSFEEKEHRALGGDVKTSYDAQKKTADISAEGNLAARSSGKISDGIDGTGSLHGTGDGNPAQTPAENECTAIPATYDRIPYSCIVKGDAKFTSIATASVLAKTYRDEYMRKLAAEYPGYGWEHNMGYPTKEHIDALIRLGPTPQHRKSFHLKELEPALF